MLVNLSLEDAVKYLEGIASNEEDCYYCAKQALDYAVSKYGEILRYVDDYKTIKINSVIYYATEQFEHFLNYEMKKIKWNFEG